MASFSKDTIITAARGETWDALAFRYYGDARALDAIRRAPDNARKFSDVLTFDGGEQITLPAAILATAAVIAPAPWEA